MQKRVKESRHENGAEDRGRPIGCTYTWLTPYKRNLKASEQKWICAGECSMLLPASFAIDHIIPIHMGGTNDWTNLCALCLQCHGKKTAFENDRNWDRRREPILGLSKYFSPGSTFFLPTPIPPPGVLGRSCAPPN